MNSCALCVANPRPATNTCHWCELKVCNRCWADSGVCIYCENRFGVDGYYSREEFRK